MFFFQLLYLLKRVTKKFIQWFNKSRKVYKAKFLRILEKFLRILACFYWMIPSKIEGLDKLCGRRYLLSLAEYETAAKQYSNTLLPSRGSL